MTAGPAAVDVVIAVHSTSRPIRRAVESVVAASAHGLSRALVVAHGIPADDIARELTGIDPARLRIAEFADGIRSPAGPFNHGIAVSDAEYVLVMGSDDTLAPGTVDAALTRLTDTSADVAILPLRYATGEVVRSPLTRWRRTRGLDPVRDRLFTRTAPLAIIRRSVVADLGLRFDTRFPAGVDIEFGIRLWAGAGATYHPEDPGYVIWEDAGDRVTMGAAADLGDALAAGGALAASTWLRGLPPAVRRSIAVKLIRVHLLGAVARRVGDPRAITDAETTAAAAFLRGWLAVGPGAPAPFSIADRRLIAALAEGHGDAAIREAAACRAAAGRAAMLIPRNPLRVFDRESTLRRYLLYGLYASDRRWRGSH